MPIQVSPLKWYRYVSPCILRLSLCGITSSYRTFLSHFIDSHVCFFDFSQLWDTFYLNDHDIPWYPMISHDIPWYSPQKTFAWSVTLPRFFFASDSFTRCFHWAWGYRRCETTFTWAAAGLKTTVGTVSFRDSSLGWCGNMWTNIVDEFVATANQSCFFMDVFFEHVFLLGITTKATRGNYSLLWFAKCLWED